MGVLAELQKRTQSEEAMCDESLSRPAKKGRPRLKNREEKGSTGNQKQTSTEKSLLESAPLSIDLSGASGTENLNIGLDLDNMEGLQHPYIKTEDSIPGLHCTVPNLSTFGDISWS